MIANAKYVHTNLIARDWRSLVRFYEEVLGCVRLPPERDYAGDDLASGSGVPNAHLQGIHLRLPGCGADGPTLEVFQYSEMREGVGPAANRPGFAHIAFAVGDVVAARDEVLAHGGSSVGDVVCMSPDPGHQVTWCYVADPEGNLLELQSWSS
ncbi:MAG: VOC family protein [Deltaproteobacteria bacterium]|nr:VOC family protein [Deltaproteobacteria bacterium]